MIDKGEIFERLNEVFQDVFDDESIKVNPKTTAKDIEDWDSLEHIRLIAAVGASSECASKWAKYPP